MVQSHFIVKPNLVLRLGWGFDNEKKVIRKYIDVINCFKTSDGGQVGSSLDSWLKLISNLYCHCVFAECGELLRKVLLAVKNNPTQEIYYI